MHINKKLVISLRILMLTSIASPMKLQGMQEEWHDVSLELREIITALSPDFKQAITFLAWQPHHVLRHSEPVTSVAIADGIIVTGSSCEARVKVWDRNTYKLITELRHNDYVRSVAVADDIIVTG